MQKKIYGTVLDYDTTAGNTDVLQLNGINANQVWLTKSGNDLRVLAMGTTDQVTVQNWFLGSAYHVEQIKSGDGKTLVDTNVQKLVDVMATFAPPTMAQTSWTSLSSDAQAKLAPLAVNWAVAA